MFKKTTTKARDGGIRAAGALLLLFGWVLLRWLFKVASPPSHDATMLQYAAAGCGFICLSLGGVFLALGDHIFDEVEVSARWANRPRLDDPRRQPPSSASLRSVCEGEFAPAATTSLDDLVARRRAAPSLFGIRRFRR